MDCKAELEEFIRAGCKDFEEFKKAFKGDSEGYVKWWRRYDIIDDIDYYLSIAMVKVGGNKYEPNLELTAFAGEEVYFADKANEEREVYCFVEDYTEDEKDTPNINLVIAKLIRDAECVVLNSSKRITIDSARTIIKKLKPYLQQQ
jgi:hypothetical protein